MIAPRTQFALAFALATSACQTQPPAPSPPPVAAAATDAAPVAAAGSSSLPAPQLVVVPAAATAPAVGIETTKHPATTCTQVPRELPLEQRCAMAGAVVHKFGSACVGKCSAVEQQRMCAQVLTQGCQCPAGKCIDDKSGCCRPLRR